MSVVTTAFNKDILLEEKVIMHELGHNLFLHHGGFEQANGKPNYLSTMNYRYSLLRPVDEDPLTGDLVRGDPKADFEHAGGGEGVPSRPILYANAWVESEGIEATHPADQNNPLYWGKLDCPDGAASDTGLPPGDTAACESSKWKLPFDPVDWNCDCDTEDVVDYPGFGGTLVPFDDWAYLRGEIDNPLADDQGAYRFMCRGQGEATSSENGALVEVEPRQLTPEVSVEPSPSCPSTRPVATNGTGRVRVLVLGTAEVDVADIVLARLQLEAARVQDSAYADFSGDQVTDLLVSFRSEDLVKVGNPWLPLYAPLDGGGDLLRHLAVDWIGPSESVDTDGDGVFDLCDACPSSAAAWPSLDGCP